MEIKAINVYLLTFETKCRIKKIDWLMFHLGRCKKESDIIKLTIMVISEISYITCLVPAISYEINGIIEMLVPKRLSA